MAPKSPMILGGSGKIPYRSEQGVYFAQQGIKVPCSAENRDNSRLMRRLFDAFRAQARPAEKIRRIKERKMNRSTSICSFALPLSGVAPSPGAGLCWSDSNAPAFPDRGNCRSSPRADNNRGDNRAPG